MTDHAATDTPQEIERHYSIKETTSLLPVHEATIRRLINRGELRAVRVGTRLLIPASAIAEYLETRAA